MSRRIGPSFNTGCTIADIVAFWRQVPCRKCHASVGLPCIDHRSYDKDLYCTRVHRVRRRVVAVLVEARRAADD